MNQKDLPETSVLGTKIHACTEDEVFNFVLDRIKSRQSTIQISQNVAKLLQCRENQKLLMISNNADIINPDGMPLKWLVSLRTRKNCVRMGGLDYMYGLAKRDKNIKFYLLGGRQEVVETVARQFKEKVGINVAGYRNGYFNKEEINSVIDDINASKPDVLFVAMGTPAKEYFIHDHRNKINAPFLVGVGGAFDIIAGKTRRAPLWMQALGLEWFYRLLQEPRRMWKRYLTTNSMFIYLVLQYALVSIFRLPFRMFSPHISKKS